MKGSTEPSMPAAGAVAAAPRLDRKFVEEHQLVERYLDDKLPFKAKLDLESWCRANPAFLDELRLAEHATAGLRLLEACGRPPDLREPPPPWWRTVYFTVGLVLACVALAFAGVALYAQNVALRSDTNREHALTTRGTLTAATTHRAMRVAPDHVAGLGGALVHIDHGAPDLIELAIDMGYSREYRFRLFVDKREQGRALVLDSQLKDSNGDLKIAFNSSGMSAGAYDVRIEAEPTRGDPIPEGWFVLDVR
jgi:hypothetical protein